MKLRLTGYFVGCLSIALAASGCAQWSWTPWAAQSAAPAVASASPKPSTSEFGEKGSSWGRSPAKSGAGKTFALAKLSENRGQMEQAERLYLEAIQEVPDDPAPHHRLGVLYSKRGKMREAEDHFAKALALKPNDPQLLSDIGYFYYLDSRMEEAERYLRRALETDPANASYCNNLALVLGELGKDEECVAFFRKAGSRTQADANYAYVLAQRGDYKRSLSMYDRVLTEDHSSRVAADAMVELSKYAKPKQQPAAPATPIRDRVQVAEAAAPPGSFARSIQREEAASRFGDALPASQFSGADAVRAEVSEVPSTVSYDQAVTYSSGPALAPPVHPPETGSTAWMPARQTEPAWAGQAASNGSAPPAYQDARGYEPSAYYEPAPPPADYRGVETRPEYQQNPYATPPSHGPAMDPPSNSQYRESPPRRSGVTRLSAQPE